jgi:hypothetical protein
VQVHCEAIYAEYIGLDYELALDLHLYHYVFRDMVSWAMANGKSPFAGSKQVLRYLSRYIHRVVISNRRLIAADEASSPAFRTLAGLKASASAFVWSP